LKQLIQFLLLSNSLKKHGIPPKKHSYSIAAIKLSLINVDACDIVLQINELDQIWFMIERYGVI